MSLLVDIPKPKAWPPPSLKDSDGVQKLLAYGYQRDPVGDKVHTMFACLYLFCLPLTTAPASTSLVILFVHSLLRLPTTWRTLTPLLKSSVYWSIIVWALYSTLSIAWSSDRTMGWDHAGSMWITAIPIPMLLWPVLRRWKWLIAAGLAGVVVQNLLQLSEIAGSWFLDGNDWISIVKNKFKDTPIPITLERPIGLDNHEGNGSPVYSVCIIDLAWRVDEQAKPENRLAHAAAIAVSSKPDDWLAWHVDEQAKDFISALHTDCPCFLWSCYSAKQGRVGWAWISDICNGIHGF